MVVSIVLAKAEEAAVVVACKWAGGSRAYRPMK